jgi:hypothetical protein
LHEITFYIGVHHGFIGVDWFDIAIMNDGIGFGCNLSDIIVNSHFSIHDCDAMERIGWMLRPALTSPNLLHLG